MSVDDIAAQGAEPLFFLDYLSVGKVVPETVDEIVSGVAEGCRQAGCALIGGEMSEHPDLMEPGEFDLVGFAVGVVERARDPAAATCAPATRSSASRSPGLRCNGYSLARRALLDRAGRALDEPAWAGAHHSLGDELLRPERDLRAGAGRAAPPRRRARVRAHHRRRDPRQPRPRRSPTDCDARRAPRHVGRAADLRRDPARRRRRATTRWSRSSTSGSACSRSCRAATRSARSTRCAPPGHDAWVVGEIVDGHGRVHVDRSLVAPAAADRPAVRSRPGRRRLLEPARPRATRARPHAGHVDVARVAPPRRPDPERQVRAARTRRSSPACGRGTASTRRPACPARRDRAREQRAAFRRRRLDAAASRREHRRARVAASSRYAAAPGDVGRVARGSTARSPAPRRSGPTAGSSARAPARP